jgi:Zn-finger nucleic acid-binding protein
MRRLTVQLADVDQCPECEGVWFDNSAPELLDVLRAGQGRLPEQLRKSLKSETPRPAPAPERTYRCPRCGTVLRTYWYGGDANRSFLVDGCTRGCGFWLDDGELGQAFDLLKRDKPGATTTTDQTGVLDRVEVLRQSRNLKR